LQGSVALPLLVTAAVAVAGPREPEDGETSATPQVPLSRRRSEGTAATVAQATLLALAVQGSLARRRPQASTVLAAAVVAAVVEAAPAPWLAVWARPAAQAARRPMDSSWWSGEPMIYALIKAGTVVNTVVVMNDPAMPALMAMFAAEYDAVVRIDTLDPVPGVWWTYLGGTNFSWGEPPADENP
jgi:hypothetical protein